MIDVDNVRVIIDRRVIILVFEIDDFIKIIYSYLNLLKSSVEEVIYYFITHIFILLELFKVLLIAFLLRDNRVRARFNLLKLEIFIL